MLSLLTRCGKHFLLLLHTKRPFVVDALDECRGLDRNDLIEAITSACHGSSRSHNLKFLLTSRQYEYIRRQFDKSLGSLMSSIHLQGDSGPAANKIAAEIEIVIKSRIEKTANVFGLSPDNRKLLEEQLKIVENRTYLWVTLVFDGLMDSECQASIERDDILSLTTKLPQSVYDAYKKILNKSPRRNDARRIFISS